MIADEKSILAAPSLTIHRASLAGWQLQGCRLHARQLSCGRAELQHLVHSVPQTLYSWIRPSKKGKSNIHNMQ